MHQILHTCSRLWQWIGKAVFCGSYYTGGVQALLRVILMLLFPCLTASEADIQGRHTSLLNDSTEYYELHLEQSKTKVSESSNH